MTLDIIETWHSIVRTRVASARSVASSIFGHLQLAVYFAEKVLQKYHQFKGDRPRVLDQ